MRLIGLLLMVVLIHPAEAQTSEDALRFSHRESGTTARTLGMAGVGAGGIDDWGATVANPASLALVGGTHITGSLDLSTIASSSESGSFIRDSRRTRFAPGHGAYVHTFPVTQGSLVLGIGAQRITSLDRSITFSGRGASGYDLAIIESGYIAEFGAVAALALAPGVYGGFSFNVLGGTYAATIDDSFAGNEVIDSVLRGFNMRAGITAEIIPGMRIGLSAETPSWIHTEETFSQSGQGTSLFNYTVQTPWRATTGIVYEVDRYLFAVDLAFVDYPNTRLRPTDIPEFSDENFYMAEAFRESLDLRVGSEIGFNLGALRLGYAFAQDPMRDEISTDRTRHTFASGISYYVVPGVTFDLGVSYTRFQDQIFTSSSSMPGPPDIENVDYLRVLAGIQYNL